MFIKSTSPGARRQKGFTLMEVMIVLGVAAVILIGIFARGSDAYDEATAQTMAGDTQLMAGKIQKMFRNSPAPRYSGLTSTVALDGNAVPQHWRNGSNITTEWGNITLGTASSNTRFTMSFAGVPQEACTAFTTALLGTFDSIAVNGTAVANTATVTTNCANATNTVLITGG